MGNLPKIKSILSILYLILSIVGHLFFSIYINDIVKCTEKFNCILYADDTTLHSTVHCFGKEKTCYRAKYIG